MKTPALVLVAVALVATIGCSSKAQPSVSSWQHVRLVELSDEVSGRCLLLGKVHAIHGEVGHMDANIEVVRRKIRKKARSIGGDTAKIVKYEETITLHGRGSRTRIDADVFRCASAKV